MALSSLTTIKVGTITALVNLLFLTTYIIITKFKHPKKYLLQLISVMLLGSLINLFSYNILANLLLTNYLFRILLIGLSTITSGLSIGMIINYGQITFPIESFCVAIEERTGIPFIKVRYSIDIISVIISLLITCLFLKPLFIREGTIISLLLLSFSINFMKNHYKNKQ